MANRWTDFSAIKRTFSNRNYAVYVSGNSISQVGTWVQRLAVGWLAWELTRSGFWLGAVAFADLFPVIFVGPFGGAIADRVNRVKVILICQILATLQALALFVLTATGVMTIEMLFMLTLLHGAITGLNQSARQALIHSLVRREDLTSAIAINATIFNLARFVGPALAGFIIATSGVAMAFLVNAISFLAFFVSLLYLRLPPQVGPTTRSRGIFRDIGEGFGYATRHSIIAPMLLISFTIAMCARPLAELLPAVTDLLFGHGPEGLAILTAAQGIGAVIGSTWLAKRGEVRGMSRIVLGSLVVACLAILAVVHAPHLWAAAAAMAVFGSAQVCSGTGIQTLVQVTVSDEMRGRVLSLSGLIMRGGPALGALVMGSAADFVGLQLPLAVGAGLCLIMFAVMLPRERRIRRLVEAPEDGQRLSEKTASNPGSPSQRTRPD